MPDHRYVESHTIGTKPKGVPFCPTLMQLRQPQRGWHVVVALWRYVGMSGCLLCSHCPSESDVCNAQAEDVLADKNQRKPKKQAKHHVSHHFPYTVNVVSVTTIVIVCVKPPRTLNTELYQCMVAGYQTNHG